MIDDDDKDILIYNLKQSQERFAAASKLQEVASTEWADAYVNWSEAVNKIRWNGLSEEVDATLYGEYDLDEMEAEDIQHQVREENLREGKYE